MSSKKVTICGCQLIVREIPKKIQVQLLLTLVILLQLRLNHNLWPERAIPHHPMVRTIRAKNWRRLIAPVRHRKDTRTTADRQKAARKAQLRRDALAKDVQEIWMKLDVDAQELARKYNMKFSKAKQLIFRLPKVKTRRELNDWNVFQHAKKIEIKKG